MLDIITSWLSSISHQIALATNFTVQPITGDASARKYYLLNTNNQQFIIMQTPNDHSMKNFITIAEYLSTLNLSCNVPKIYANSNTSPTAFLLTNYFGDQLLFKLLNINTAEEIYKLAWQNLSDIQTNAKHKNINLPLMNQIYIKNNLLLFKNYYLETHLKLTNITNINNILSNLENYFVTIFKEQPQVFVHLDYHSKNLILNSNKLSILDFQDAMHGPVTYDIVSLLQDAYLVWPEDLTEKILFNYFNKINNILLNNISFKDFLRYFYLTGLQRHVKNLGVFARLKYLYKKNNYLQYIPNLLNYINTTCNKFKEPELIMLKQLLCKQ